MGPLPGFTFLPALGAIPIGLNINTGYELADLKLQWLICDFGRRLGRYRQAGLAVEIAQLQSERAYQTVANEVSVAYYQVLRTRALRKTALDAVRRAEDDLEVAKKLEKGGAAGEGEGAAGRSPVGGKPAAARCRGGRGSGGGRRAQPGHRLERQCSDRRSGNLGHSPFHAIPGRVLANSGRPAARIPGGPPIDPGGRRRPARGQGRLCPTNRGRGLLLDFQQSAPRGHADLAVGVIKLEWGLFEGGKRVAELRMADSKIRAAMAQAESIADTIAFQVTEAYRHLITARRGHRRSRPAVAQAEENYRLVRARAKLGDATSAEITDAESTLTRAQQEYLNSIHDYLIALVRLEYAMGVNRQSACAH